MRMRGIGLLAAAAMICLVSNAETAKTEGGLTFAALPRAAKELRVTLRAVSTCHFGDFEALMFEAAHDQTGRMLVSLEPVAAGDKSFPVQTQIIASPRKIIEGGYTVSFSLDKLPPRALAGVYICKDSSQANSCRSKKTEPVQSVMVKYRNPLPPGFRPEDRTYYFAPLIVTPEEVRLITNALNAEREKELGDLVSQLFKGDAAAKASLKTIFANSSTLGSMPLAFGKGEADLILPRYDRFKCGSSAEPDTVFHFSPLVRRP